MATGKRWKVVIAEDHLLLRAGLRGLLEQESDMEVVGEADNGRDAVRLVGQLNPHILVSDLSMPGSNGIEAIVSVKRRYPHVKVLVLTVHKADEYIYASLKAGANGYILKTAAYQELLYAIRFVLAGKVYLSPEISAEVVAGLIGAKAKQPASATLDSLTHRERQVLQLVAEGRTSKYIAAYLSVSVKTVDKHRTNLMKKLGLHHVASLTSFAIKMGVTSGYGDTGPGLEGA